MTSDCAEGCTEHATCRPPEDTKRCPYSTQVWLPGGQRLLVRCARRRTLWGHKHRAPMPSAWDGRPISGSKNVALRWWSSGTPDYHVEYERASAEVIE